MDTIMYIGVIELITGNRNNKFKQTEFTPVQYFHIGKLLNILGETNILHLYDLFDL